MYHELYLETECLIWMVCVSVDADILYKSFNIISGLSNLINSFCLPAECKFTVVVLP